MNIPSRHPITLLGTLLLLAFLATPAFPTLSYASNNNSNNNSNNEGNNEGNSNTSSSSSEDLVVSGNCIAFSTAKDYEEELKSYENEMKDLEKNKADEEKQKKDDYGNKKNEENALISSGDEDNVANEHVAKKKEYAKLEDEANKAKDDHDKKSKDHEDKRKEHEDKASKFDSHEVPDGTTACKTPDGDLGFLPSSTAGVISSKPKKALREVFGQ